jgi:hypothetical protein
MLNTTPIPSENYADPTSAFAFGGGNVVSSVLPFAASGVCRKRMISDCLKYRLASTEVPLV